jgi:chemotaxis protein methyltransferase CheR
MDISQKKTLQEVCRIVSEMAGIQLGEKQYAMVESRLRSRMMRLKIEKFDDYLPYLQNHLKEESQALLSLLTTHHTYFFREFTQFEFLIERGLRELIDAARARPDRTIKIWSAACSRGQEVYSLAMFFERHLASMAPDLKFEIYGTDVDPESIATAKNGVYRVEEVRQSPSIYVEGHWIRGQEEISDFMKAKSQLKSYCHFQVVNLFEPQNFLQGKIFDLILCRNVFIYFSADQIKKVTEQILSHLQPHGIYMLGVSESLNGMQLPLASGGPSIYRHKEFVQGTSSKTPALISEKILEVLCVDDSPTILSMLNKILSSEKGFRVKATASQGQQALDLLKREKFDVITLDLHMPVMDGLEFLRNRGEGNTPVLIVSSVQRDDVNEAQKAIELGASDYIEKPTLQNIEEAGNQIRSKLKTVFKSRQIPALKAVSGPKPSLLVTKSRFRKKVLIVDDSKVMREILKQIISADPELEVMGEADRPSAAEVILQKQKPDVMTLDIYMPEMDGVTWLRKAYPLYKIPTVMISSISREEGPKVLQALECGAVDYMQKPEMSELKDSARQLCERIRMAANTANNQQRRPAAKKTSLKFTNPNQGLILLGASTGGTEALRAVLESLPDQIPPILIVQHIPAVFSRAFADRLNKLVAFEVREARDGDLLRPDQVLIAPGGKQMGVKAKASGELFVKINSDPALNRHRPSVDYLFGSVADLRLSYVTAALLTGMGADGAMKLKALRDLGVRTIAQDQSTSVIFGMPREAISLGAAELVLPLDQIAENLVKLHNEQSSTRRTKQSA